MSEVPAFVRGALAQARLALENAEKRAEARRRAKAAGREVMSEEVQAEEPS